MTEATLFVCLFVCLFIYMLAVIYFTPSEKKTINQRKEKTETLWFACFDSYGPDNLSFYKRTSIAKK